MHTIPDWYYDSLPPEGRGEVFRTSEKLKNKVDENGRLKFFCGETTVFMLPEGVREHLMQVQGQLYTAAGDMLCPQRLGAADLHMTLHSFWDMEEEIKYGEVPYVHEEVFRTLDGLRRDFPGDIMMRTVCPLNMVNTSVVMGLAAATEADGRALREIYERMSVHYPRSYGLTPHITLAYYRPGEYPEEVWRGLKSAFRAGEFVFPINTRSLFFKRFFDMDRYETVY